MAEAINLPVVSHGVPEVHAHLVGRAPNWLTIKYVRRLFDLWEALPIPENGLLAIPTARGLGLNFSQHASRRSAF